MGYHGYSPGNSFEDLSDFEKLLRGLPLEAAKACLDLVETLTRNVIQSPGEEKFRRIRTTNEKLAALFGTPGSMDIMHDMGWQTEGDFIVLPKEVKLDFPKHIVKILEAKGHYAKQQATKKGSAKFGRDPAKSGLMQELELDRRERAAVAPTATAPTSEAAPCVADAAQVVAPAPIAASADGVQEEAHVAAPIAASADGDWTCSSCTFGNAKGKATCEMCDSARPVFAADTFANRNAGTSPDNGAQGDIQKPVQKPNPASEFQPPERQPAPVENKENRKEMSLQELRALQKSKYGDFKSDPNGGQSDAYKQPASTVGGSQEAGWFDWMWGGSSSSGGGSGSGGGGTKPPHAGKPRMKTIADLPKPVARGGG